MNTDDPIPAIVDRVRAVAAEVFSVERGDLGAGVSLDVVAAVDSIGQLEFLVALEKEFGIELEIDRIDYDLLVDLDRLAREIGGRIDEGAAR